MTISSIRSIRADSSYMYVLTTLNLQIYDISSITAISLSSETTLSTETREFVLDEDLVFIPIQGVVHIYNVSDRSSASVFVDAIPTVDLVNDIKLNGTDLLFSDPIEGILSYDVTDVNNISPISSINIPRTVQHFEISSNFIFVAMGLDGIEMYDISNSGARYWSIGLILPHQLLRV